MSAAPKQRKGGRRKVAANAGLSRANFAAGTPPTEIGGKEEVARRLLKIRTLLVAGASRAEIVRWCGIRVDDPQPGEEAKRWDVTPATAMEYIRRAWAQLEEDDEEERKNERTKLRLQTEFYLRQAAQDRAWGAVARFTDILAKLTGAYKPARVEMTHGMLPPEEAMRRIDAAYKTMQVAKERGVIDIEGEEKPRDD